MPSLVRFVAAVILVIISTNAMNTMPVRDRKGKIKEAHEVGGTILHDAVKKQNINLVFKVITHVAKTNSVSCLQALLNAPDLQGCTALHYALDNKNYSIMELLVQSGASIQACHGRRASVFLCAVSRNEKKPVGFFLNHCNSTIDVNKVEDGTTPLLEAAKNNNFTMIKLFKEKGQKLDFFPQGCHEQSVIEYAMRAGSRDILEWCLQEAPSDTIRLKWAQAALMCAIADGRTEIAQELVTNYSGVMNGTVALVMSLERNNPSIALLLLRICKNLNVNAKTWWKMPLLSHVLDLDDPEEFAVILLARGASMMDVNSTGISAWDRVQKNEDRKLREIFLSYCSEWDLAATDVSLQEIASLRGIGGAVNVALKRYQLPGLVINAFLSLVS